MIVRPLSILLVEDNPGDVRLTQEALRGVSYAHYLNIVENGIEAMKYLKREPPYTSASRPDLIFLDLNLPEKDGREVLKDIKEDASLRLIPVIILTSSDDMRDITRSYAAFANCYVTKPMDLPGYMTVIQQITQFWAAVAKLPVSS